jgi:acyl-CoA oxidase
VCSGDLGCFSLTEKFAGVNSGLVVHTTAAFDPSSGEFVLNTPDEGAKKNWISQGFVADKT